MMSPLRCKFRAHKFTAAINTYYIYFCSYHLLNWITCLSHYELPTKSNYAADWRTPFLDLSLSLVIRVLTFDVPCKEHRVIGLCFALLLVINSSFIYVSINEQRKPKLAPQRLQPNSISMQLLRSLWRVRVEISHVILKFFELCETFPQRVHFLNFIIVLELMCNEFQMHSVSVSRLNHIYVSQILICVRIRTNSFCGRDLWAHLKLIYSRLSPLQHVSKWLM